MSRKLDVLCVSDMCADLLVRGNTRPRFRQVEQLVDEFRMELGGSANLFASQFVKLGGTAGIIGWVGDDLLGRFLMERLGEIGIDASRVRRKAGAGTGAGIALIDGDDRAMLTFMGTIDRVEPGELRKGLTTQCRHWHIASFYLLTKIRHAWKALLRRLKSSGVTVSLDTNWDPAEKWDSVDELLPFVDIFLPNEAEAIAISGEKDFKRAGRKLSSSGTLVVVKRGGKAPWAFHGGKIWEGRIPKGARHRVVDTTGGGDSFDAGFVRSWQLGYTVDDSLVRAFRCGQACISAIGGIAGQLKENVRPNTRTYNP